MSGDNLDQQPVWRSEDELRGSEDRLKQFMTDWEEDKPGVTEGEAAEVPQEEPREELDFDARERMIQEDFDKKEKEIQEKIDAENAKARKLSAELDRFKETDEKEIAGRTHSQAFSEGLGVKFNIMQFNGELGKIKQEREHQLEKLRQERIETENREFHQERDEMGVGEKSRERAEEFEKIQRGLREAQEKKQKTDQVRESEQKIFQDERFEAGAQNKEERLREELRELENEIGNICFDWGICEGELVRLKDQIKETTTNLNKNEYLVNRRKEVEKLADDFFDDLYSKEGLFYKYKDLYLKYDQIKSKSKEESSEMKSDKDYEKFVLKKFTPYVEKGLNQRTFDDILEENKG